MITIDEDKLKQNIHDGLIYWLKTAMTWNNEKILEDYINMLIDGIISKIKGEW